MRHLLLWRLGGGKLAALLLLPVIGVLLLALSPDIYAGDLRLSQFLSQILPVYGTNSLILIACVGGLAGFIGTATAWIMTVHLPPLKGRSPIDVQLRRLIDFMLVLPLAMPAYLSSFVYAEILTTSLSLRGITGAVIILSLALYPYVYLLARAAFREQPQRLFEAGRSLGRGRLYCFWRLALPVAWPAIMIGLTLVMLETLSDFGVTSFLGVHSLSTGIFELWQSLGAPGAAARLALSMLVIAAALVALQHITQPRGRSLTPPTTMHKAPHANEDALPENVPDNHTAPPQKPRLPRQTISFAPLLTGLLCCIPPMLGFVIPAVYLGYLSLRHWQAQANPALLNSVLTSLTFALITAAILAVLGLFLAYGTRLTRSRFLAAIARLATSGYALPGAVLAVGVLYPLTTFDHGLNHLTRLWLDWQPGLILSGSAFILIYAYCTRFFTVSLAATETALNRLPLSLDDAARLHGLGPWQRLGRIHLPLLKGGLLSGAILVFFDVMKELPATLLLRPFGIETVAIRTYEFAINEMLSQAALGGLTIVMAGLVPVWILLRAQDKD